MPSSYSWKLSNIFLLLTCLFLLVSTLKIHSQESTYFKVIHLPRKAGYSKERLNEEIAGLKDKSSVIRIIRLKNFPPVQIILQVKNQDDHYSWWTVNPATGYERETQDIILQSQTGRGEEKQDVSLKPLPVIKQPTDFKELLKNSIILIDTLFIGLQLDDNGYPDDKYCFYFTCNSGEINMEMIPFINGQLVISEQLFKSCFTDDFITLSLYNRKNNQQRLSHCYIRFLTAAEKDALLDLAKSYKNIWPGFDIYDIAKFVTTYLEQGSPWYPQLLHWLETSLDKK